jgi:hypothetical protein
MVHSTFQHPPPHSHTLSVSTVHWEGGGWGRRSERRYSRGATVHKYSSFIIHGGLQFTSWVGGNTNHEWVYLQSIKSVKQNAANSVNRSTERKADIYSMVWCLYSSFVHVLDVRTRGYNDCNNLVLPGRWWVAKLILRSIYKKGFFVFLSSFVRFRPIWPTMQYEYQKIAEFDVDFETVKKPLKTHGKIY